MDDYQKGAVVILLIASIAMTIVVLVGYIDVSMIEHIPYAERTTAQSIRLNDFHLGFVYSLGTAIVLWIVTAFFAGFE